MSEKRDKAIDNLTDVLFTLSEKIARATEHTGFPDNSARIRLWSELRNTIADFADALVEDDPAPCEVDGCHRDATTEMWFGIGAGGVVHKMQVCDDHRDEELKLRQQRDSQKQTSGPQCKRCGGFTIRTRVESHGLCMRCETLKCNHLLNGVDMLRQDGVCHRCMATGETK